MFKWKIRGGPPAAMASSGRGDMTPSEVLIIIANVYYYS